LPPDKVLIWHSRLVDTDLNFQLTLSLTFYPDTRILINSLFPESSIQFSLSVVSDSLEKTLMLGKIEGRRSRG